MNVGVHNEVINELNKTSAIVGSTISDNSHYFVLGRLLALSCFIKLYSLHIFPGTYLVYLSLYNVCSFLDTLFLGRVLAFSDSSLYLTSSLKNLPGGV